MRIARTTLVLLLANLVAFGLVWRATSAHRQTAANQDLLFPAALAKIELTESGQKLVLEKRPSSWRITAPIEWPANLWAVQRLLDEIRFIDGDKGFATAETKAAGGSLATYGLTAPRWILRTTSDAGATLVQVYTGLIYRGPGLVSECVEAIRGAERIRVANRPAA